MSMLLYNHSKGATEKRLPHQLRREVLKTKLIRRYGDMIKVEFNFKLKKLSITYKKDRSARTRTVNATKKVAKQ